MLKNLIFDLGNVIIDLDLDRTTLELKQLLGQNLEEQLIAKQCVTIFEDYEKGLCSEADFLATLQSLAPPHIGTRRIIDAWNAMLIGTPKSRLEMLSRLKKQYNVFLLSNTNHTHLQWVYDDLERTHQVTDFDTQFFHKAYYSHLIKLRKPDATIYEFVLQDAQLIAAETLFIDDNAANIAAAKQLGINTYHHRIGDDITAIIDSLL